MGSRSHHVAQPASPCHVPWALGLQARWMGLASGAVLSDFKYFMHSGTCSCKASPPLCATEGQVLGQCSAQATGMPGTAPNPSAPWFFPAPMCPPSPWCPLSPSCPQSRLCTLASARPCCCSVTLLKAKARLPDNPRGKIPLFSSTRCQETCP